MKVRIGYGLGTSSTTLDGPRFADLVDALEANRFDSLWLSERVNGDCPDPMVGLAFAAARSTKLKLGTSVQVLPGRNVHLLAKAWASLDRLTGGRCLPAFGLGTADPREQAAFGVERKARAAIFDEALPKLRRLWAGEEVDGASILPVPVQQPMDVWLGGAAPAELRRVGRHGDGWLPSFCSPADVAEGREAILAAAATHGRTIDPEHWGALVPYLTNPGPLPDRLAALIEARRPGQDPSQVVPAGFDELRALLQRFTEVEASKFVLVPIGEPDDWPSHLATVADAVLDLVT